MEYKIKLKELRLEKNLTQKEVASLLNMARQTYNHYEAQENIIPIKHLDKIAKLYDVSVDYILGLSKIKKEEKTYKSVDINISSKRLKEFRLNNGLTQEQLAKILNTFHTVIVDYEKGKNLIATPFLYTICLKFKTSADYLLGRI